MTTNADHIATLERLYRYASSEYYIGPMSTEDVVPALRHVLAALRPQPPRPGGDVACVRCACVLLKAPAPAHCEDCPSCCRTCGADGRCDPECPEAWEDRDPPAALQSPDSYKTPCKTTADDPSRRSSEPPRHNKLDRQRAVACATDAETAESADLAAWVETGDADLIDGTDFADLDDQAAQLLTFRVQDELHGALDWKARVPSPVTAIDTRELSWVDKQLLNPEVRKAYAEAMADDVRRDAVIACLNLSYVDAEELELLRAKAEWCDAKRMLDKFGSAAPAVAGDVTAPYVGGVFRNADNALAALEAAAKGTVTP